MDIGGPAVSSFFQENVLDGTLLLAHTTGAQVMASMTSSHSREHLCSRSAHRRDRAEKLHSMRTRAVARSELHASAIMLCRIGSSSLEASSRVSGPVDARAR